MSIHVTGHIPIMMLLTINASAVALIILFITQVVALYAQIQLTAIAIYVPITHINLLEISHVMLCVLLLITPIKWIDFAKNVI